MVARSFQNRRLAARSAYPPNMPDTLTNLLPYNWTQPQLMFQVFYYTVEMYTISGDF